MPEVVLWPSYEHIHVSHTHIHTRKHICMCIIPSHIHAHTHTYTHTSLKTFACALAPYTHTYTFMCVLLCSTLMRGNIFFFFKSSYCHYYLCTFYLAPTHLHNSSGSFVMVECHCHCKCVLGPEVSSSEPTSMSRLKPQNIITNIFKCDSLKESSVGPDQVPLQSQRARSESRDK